jgi:hypothetical protein
MKLDIALIRPTTKEQSIMCTRTTSPAIEGGGGRDDTFLARTIPQTPAAMAGSASFFPFRGTRSLHPLPAGLAGAGIVERLQDSIRARLREARDDWTFVSVLSVGNSPDTPST